MARGALTDYAANKVFDAIARATNLTAPTTIYLALFTGDPGSGLAGATEFTGGGYARKAVTFAAPTTGSAATNAAVEFNEATADLGGAGGFAVYDAASGGNGWFHGAFDVVRTVATGVVYQVDSGQITLDVNNAS